MSFASNIKCKQTNNLNSNVVKPEKNLLSQQIIQSYNKKKKITYELLPQYMTKNTRVLKKLISTYQKNQDNSQNPHQVKQNKIIQPLLSKYARKTNENNQKEQQQQNNIQLIRQNIFRKHEKHKFSIKQQTNTMKQYIKHLKQSQIFIIKNKISQRPIYDDQYDQYDQTKSYKTSINHKQNKYKTKKVKSEQSFQKQSQKCSINQKQQIDLKENYFKRDTPYFLPQQKQSHFKIQSPYKQFIQSQKQKINLQKQKLNQLTIQKSKPMNYQHVQSYVQPKIVIQKDLIKSNGYLIKSNNYQSQINKFKLLMNQLFEINFVSQIIKYQIKSKSFQIIYRIYQQGSQYYKRKIQLKDPLLLDQTILILKPFLINCKKSQIQIVVKKMFKQQTFISFQQYQLIFYSINNKFCYFEKQFIQYMPNQFKLNKQLNLLLQTRKLFTIWIDQNYFIGTIKTLLKLNSFICQDVIKRCSLQINYLNIDLLINYFTPYNYAENQINNREKLKIKLFLIQLFTNQIKIIDFLRWCSSTF